MKIISLLVTTDKLKFNFLHLFVISSVTLTEQQTKQNKTRSNLDSVVSYQVDHGSPLSALFDETLKKKL